LSRRHIPRVRCRNGTLLRGRQHGDRLGLRRVPGPLELAAIRRVFGYFRPYWLHGLAAVVCLAVGAGPGLAVGGLYAELYRRQFLDQEPARAGVT
jgi:hypothetical protein